MSLKNKDVLSIGAMHLREILFILEQAKLIKKDFLENNGRKYADLLKDKKMISAFFEDSTRTRTSFIEAITQLGGKYQGFAGASGTSISKGESMYHTIKMLENYGANVVVIRHNLDGAAQLLSDKIELPVINAGDGNHEHPTQTLLDLFTIQETQGRLEELTIALVGDLKYGRTVHSLLVALTHFRNIKLILVSPKELRMPEGLIELLTEKSIPFEEMIDLEQAVKQCDIVYMTRIQKERLPEELKALYDKLKKEYRLKRASLIGAKANLRILHPLPIPKSVQEIDSDIEDSKHCVYFEQAKNGLYVRMAILAICLGAIKSPDFQIRDELVQETNFVEVNIAQKLSDNKKIGDIRNGVLIDHLPSHSALEVAKLLNYEILDNVFIGLNLSSKRMGKKDIIKIESEDFNIQNLQAFNRLALRCPSATINLIKDFHIVRKGKVRLPTQIDNILECANANCISRPEHFETRETHFKLCSRDPVILECRYCGLKFGSDKFEFKKFDMD